MKIKLNDDHSNLSIKMSSTSSGSEVTKAYVDNQDNSILANAKNYTEERLNAITIPTKVSELENDKGYLNEHQDISFLASKSSLGIVEENVQNNSNVILTLSGKVDTKQDQLTAGNNITIENNVISSSGSGETYDDTAVRGLIADNKNAISTKVSKSELGTEITDYVTAHKSELKGDKGDTGATGKDGSPGVAGSPGEKGADGYTPVKGTDYYTAEDIAEFKTYIDEQILGGKW